MSDELKQYKTENAAHLAAKRVKKQMEVPEEWAIIIMPVRDPGVDHYIWELTHFTIDDERIAIQYYPSTRQYQAHTLIDEEDYGFEEADRCPQAAVERLLRRLIRRRQDLLNKLKGERAKIKGRKLPKPKCTYCAPLGLAGGRCPRCGKKGSRTKIRGKQGGKKNVRRSHSSSARDQ